MNTIRIIKAVPVEPLTILVDQEICSSPRLPEWERLCNEQAQLFCDAILSAMPQGLTDRILAELIKRKATLFIRSQRYFESLLDDGELNHDN